ncbi:hypothetical protein D3C73_939920 [compost metagenome]
MRILRQQVQRIGVDHQWQARLQDTRIQRPRPFVLAQARADRHDLGFCQQRGQRSAIFQRMRHRLRQPGQQRADMGLTRADAQQTCTSAQRGFGGHRDGTAAAMVAAHAQHMAGFTLVAVGTTRRQQIRQARLRPALCSGNDSLPGLVGQRQRGQLSAPGVFQRVAGVQATMGDDELQGQGRAHGCARHAATVGIDTAGHIQRQHQCPLRVQRLDQGLRRTAWCAGEAEAEQGVNPYIGLGQFAVEISDGSPGGPEIRRGALRQWRGR